MQLVIEPFNLEHAYWCIENNVDNLLIGYELFANRLSYSFNQSELETLINNRKQTKIWIKVNNFFFENEIQRLEMFLNWISHLDIDRVVFQDFAVCQINYENKLNLKLHYNPETLVTNYGQFPFFKQNDINSVFVSRELMTFELEEILKNKQDMQIEIQGFGYGFIMHSRWNLISNFNDHYQLNLNKDFLEIKENLRKIPNYIFEDDHGTHMFTGYLINLIPIFDQIKKQAIDFLKLDFLGTNIDLAQEVVAIYQQLLKDNLNQKQLEQINNDLNTKYNQYLMSPGFLGGKKYIYHLIKEQDE